LASHPIEVHSGFRFEVTVEGIFNAVFTECKLPSLTVETIDVKEGGQNTFSHKLPVRVNAGSVTLRHGSTHSADLLKWYFQVLSGDMENATRQVTVIMYDVAKIPVATWNFRQAYPVKWSGPTLKTDDNSVAIEELEFVHHGFTVET
jgi:phage tail-like protein